ncbi:hypothetical protein OXX59_003492 [Metschnikowia pulcherrima]
MSWSRALFKILLAGLCFAQGVLSALAYRQRHFEQILIFTIAVFALGVCSSAASYFQGSMIVILSQCVLSSFFLASSVSLVVFLGDDPSRLEAGALPPHYFPVILSLIFAAMIAIGASITYDLTSRKTYLHPSSERSGDPESEATGWQSDSSLVDELSLNKSHRASFQPPIVHLELDRHSNSEKTLRNKDSDGTLVVPIMSREDEISLNWLIQASMSNQHLYDDNTENWMSTKPITLGGDKLLSSRQFARSAVPTNSIIPAFGNMNPEVRISRSNTTGSLFVPKRSQTNRSVPRDSVVVEKRSRSVSLTRRLSTSQVLDSFRPASTCSKLNSVHLEEKIDDSAQDGDSKSEGFDDDHSTYHKPTQSTNMQHLQAQPKMMSQSERVLMRKSYSSYDISDSKRPLHQGASDHLMVSRSQPALYPAFEPQLEKESSQSPVASIFGPDMLDGLESIPMAAPRWDGLGEMEKGTMKNISLQEWENSKDQWLQLRTDNNPIIFSANRQRKSSGAVSALSAPSLHTYREQPINGSQVSANTFSTSNETLFRCVTPPQQISATTLEQPALDASPIKKMIGRFKRKDISAGNKSPTAPKKHKHSSSIANSMISVASGLSSKSGSPRKARKMFFSRVSLESPKRPVFGSTATLTRGAPTLKQDASVVPTYKFHPSLSSDKFWDSETGDYSDKSRVSSVPSAVIGEYDREKWRTMKELQRNRIDL